MYEIKSSNYIKERKVLIDGITVTMRPPGAGSELEFNRIQRRLEFLDKRLKAGTMTEPELDLYDKLEKQSLDFFGSILRDETTDNTEVKAWLDKTPMTVIQAAFEEIKKQFDDHDASESADQASGAIRQQVEAGDGTTTAKA